LPKRSLAFLSVDAVMAIHAEVLAAHGGRRGLRDRALLESAVAAPQASFDGKPLLANPIEIAAAYLFYLCRNHPFADGNTRTALASCLVFLDVNGLLPEACPAAREPAAWETFVGDVAASRIDRDQTTRRLRSLIRSGKR